MGKSTISVVDLFAGPGGLGEGFSRVNDGKSFKIVVSIEKDPQAIETLRLRAFYRSWLKSKKKLPQAYLDLLSAESEKQKSQAIDKLSELDEWKLAQEEACHLELGRDNNLIHEKISERIDKEKNWVLIGGPPCQAYSLVGRSRMKNHEGLKSDHRHFLYKEYLKIIKKFKPTVFVMENVKGLNTAKVGGKLILPRILKDLRSSGYTLHSLTSSNVQEAELVDDFLVKADQFGIPQSRHRVIIIGVRNGTDLNPAALKFGESVGVGQVIGDLPCLAGLDSSISRESYNIKQRGQPLVYSPNLRKSIPTELKSFISPLCREMEEVVLNHQARSHMSKDLERYEWWAKAAAKTGKSPTLADDIPKNLIPQHANLSNGKALVFADRFKVQLRDKPSGTITSHISKDGHYYIHYDPNQARSLSVREAARIQTFPDDYFFMGNRTQQYHQVGNAVPPYLSFQIAQSVYDVLRS